AFQTSFGFVPCYVNGRFAARGIPVACEVDIYGALSEYMCTLATGAPATLAVGDVADPDDVRRIVQTAGEVDILVSNCGGPAAGPFLSHSPEAWRHGGDLVLFSAINLTREVIEGMKARGWGRLIYITSVAVRQPLDDLIISNTFRAGLTGFIKTISNTYARFGITANSVCPGYTATDRLWELARGRALQAGTTPEEAMKQMGAGAPVGRVGRPEELGATVAFLASVPAAFITGAAIPVDGGTYKGLL
ncbi:MAG TPA: SDR family oxidoreductase, partial [candidate division Zixibacteria bacterium]|nr:SDR family oxidoreductase [candidate division Zixibacteria bacterium]